ncbi:integrase catalytic domain-containing protein [Trichonephila clavipes]|nr:integrase catalytic domain-containing protein [Trichonephila clavipes]
MQKQLQTVNDSYSSLFEALESRYENKRLIVNSHIAELLNPNKIKFESAFHLRSLIDSIQSHLRALKQLELEPNALCESMLIFVITQRLDDESRKQYEMELHSNDVPKWNNFLDFLIKRSQALENVQRNSSLKNKNEYSPKFRSFVVKSNEKTCPLCPSETHPIFKCKMFHEMSVEKRSNKELKQSLVVTQTTKPCNIFKSSVRFNSGRYEVGFPWKSHTQELNDNFSVAEKRVKSLTRRFIRDPTLYIQYSEILKEYESQGIIERVLETEKPTDRAVFYLPHQAVFRQESLTTKMRIVFDASSHEDGQPSLNDCIWSGIPWDVVHDYFVDVKGLLQLDTSKPITKRIVLQSAGKIYDPVGFLSPYTIRLKCLLLELWLRKLSWDDELPPDIHAVWSQWWLELPFLSELKIPRKILDSSGGSSEVQIHTFSDTSQKAYGAAAFFERVKHKDRVSVDLVTSRAVLHL